MWNWWVARSPSPRLSCQYPPPPPPLQLPPPARKFSQIAGGCIRTDCSCPRVIK